MDRLRSEGLIHGAAARAKPPGGRTDIRFGGGKGAQKNENHSYKYPCDGAPVPHRASFGVSAARKVLMPKRLKPERFFYFPLVRKVVIGQMGGAGGGLYGLLLRRGLGAGGDIAQFLASLESGQHRFGDVVGNVALLEFVHRGLGRSAGAGDRLAEFGRRGVFFQ